MNVNMKTIKVVAAVICDSLKDKKRIFATARGYDFKKRESVNISMPLEIISFLEGRQLIRRIQTAT